MAKIKALVRVKVFKVFEYTKSMLHKDLFIQDALNKARSDMQTFVDEIVMNDHAQIRHDMFNYEAEEEMGFKFRNRQLDKNNTETCNLMKAAKALTTIKLETKHGPLNHEQSPQLYEHEPEVRTKDGKDVIREESWYMKEQIENEFYSAYDQYIHLLRNLN